MSKYIFYLALQIFSMDGMYIQINQVKNGFVSYIDFHFIDIDLDAEQCAFYSRDGEKLHTAGLSISDGRIICNEMDIELLSVELDQIKLIFSEDPDNKGVFYKKLKKIEINDAFSHDEKLKEFNGYLFLKYTSRLNVGYLFPVLEVKENKVKYLDLLSMEIKYQVLN